MPKKKHDELLRQARAKGLTGKRRDAYVYGTLDTIKKRHNAKVARRRRR